LLQKTQRWLESRSLPPRLTSAIKVLAGQGAREGYLASADQSLISLSNFLATVILARSTTPTELGVYGVGFTTLRLVRTIQEGLTIQPMNTFGAVMDETSFRSYATSTSLIQLMLAILSSLAAAITGWVATRMGNDTAGPLLFSLWSAFLWWQLQEYIRRILYTRGMVLQAVINTAIANAARLAIMLWWVRGGSLDGVGGIQAISLGSLIALLPGLWQTRTFWSKGYASLWETWKRNWGFGRWILGGSIANWIAVEFYPVLTAGMINFAAAGAYRALQNIVAPIHLLLRATDAFLVPRAARAYQERGRAALERTLRLTYLALGIPILGVLSIAILFPTPMLQILYGDKYLAYSQGMTLMAIFYALLYASSPMQTALKATRTGRPIFVANLAAILAMFSAGVWMIRRWDVYGTLGGQILNSLIVVVILWWAWGKARKAGREAQRS
jgi:O-antigen/teichoic acid export membrane protein